MATRVKNIEKSFLQFNYDFQNDSCKDVQKICLPVFDDADIAFQLLLETDTINEANIIDDLPIQNFYLSILDNATILNNNDFITNKLYDFNGISLYFDKIRVGPKLILLYWPHGLPNFKNVVSSGDCFRVGCNIIIGNTAIRIPSNCFFDCLESCYTSLIEYSCDEDEFGFYYCDAVMPNKIRLPLFLSKPQFQDEETMYTRSNGTIKILKSVTKKEFEGRTDYLNEDLHEKIKVALSHDNVLFTSDSFTGGVRKNGNYEIEWPEINSIDVAPAKFKALVTPYLVRNSKCEQCNTCNIVLSNLNIEYRGMFTGVPFYEITWDIVSGVIADASFIKLEYSKDNGVTWHKADAAVNNNTIFYTSENTTTRSVYYLYQENASIIHKIRIKTYCEDYRHGPTYLVNYNNVCNLEVTNVQIASNDDGQGGRNYIATWVNSAPAFDYTLEVSMDGGNTWIAWPNAPFTQGARLDDVSWSYTFGNAVDEPHRIRVKPYCDAVTPGTFGEGIFI